MPNPYHDETGRFCSKGEMGEAVDRVYSQIATADNEAARGEIADRWFELKREYEQINRGVVEIPEEWVAEVSSSGLQNPLPNSTQGIEAIYRSGLSDELRKPTDFHTPKAIGLLTNAHTPQWIKDDIYRDASAEIKAGIIEEFSRDDLYAREEAKYPKVTSEELLSFTGGANGRQPKVTRALLRSEKVDFDTKYHLAKDRGQLAYLAALDGPGREAELFKSNPEIENDLKQEWKNPLRKGSARDSAALVLARNTASKELRDQLRASDTGEVVRGESITSELAKNENLSEQEGIELLRHALNTDSQNFGLIYSNLYHNPSVTGLVGMSYDDRLRQLPDTKTYGNEYRARVETAHERLAGEYARELDAGLSLYPGYRREDQVFVAKVLGEKRAADYWHQLSVADAEPDQYIDLLKKSRQLEKDYRRAARSGDRDESGSIYREQAWITGRIAGAKHHRTVSLMLAQVEAKRA